MLDQVRLANAGVRIIESEHLTLVTDAAASPAVAELPRVIAAALPQLAERFDVPMGKLRGWRLRAYLMRDREKFEALGLAPAEAGPFPYGWSLGHEAWLVDQPSDYYRRHLLLHEATHSFMMTELGGCGPAWYMEGVAELLGTHTWDARSNNGAGKLELGVMPASREATPYWGRIKRVRQSASPQAIAAVMKIDNRVPLPVESYAWSWALCKFLDAHPRYQQRFRGLHKRVLEEDFNQQFRQDYQADARQLAAEWRGFVSTLEYGHDIEREAIAFLPSSPLARGTKRLELATDRGWQPTGVSVKRGDRLRFTAEGRFVIAREADGAPWPCEANGVTLRYHGGRPLGVLLAAVGGQGLTDPLVIGSGSSFTMPRDGALFLRVNDSPAELADNEGKVVVTISHESSDE